MYHAPIFTHQSCAWQVGTAEAFPWTGGVPATALAPARGVPRSRGLLTDAHLQGLQL